MKCKMCNRQFDPSRVNGKFCSKTCSNRYFKKYRADWKTDHPVIEKDYTKGGHRAYANIKQRCENPKHPSFQSYGSRGIKLELTKEEFVEIYFSTDKCEICGQLLNDKDRNAADGRTLDRIDVSQGYKEGNLRLLCRACNCSLAHKRRNEKRGG